MTMFSIYLTDENNTSVDGVIRIYDGSTYQRVVEETTIFGSAINLEIPLGTYLIRVYSTTHTFLPRTITLEENAIYRMIGQSVLINVPSDTTLCRVYGKLVDAVGKPLVGWKIGIFAQDGMYNRNDNLSSSTGSATSDAYGNVEFDLLRGYDYIFSNVPIVQYSNTIYDIVSRTAHVPNQSVCSLIDIIIPRPVFVVAPTEYVGPTVQINPIVYLSDGTELSETYEFKELDAFIGNVKAEYDSVNYKFIFNNLIPGEYRVLFKTKPYVPVGATNNEASPIKRVGPERNINYIDITVA